MKKRLTLISFGYKRGPVLPADLIFDIRYVENPYDVVEFRPKTGLDKEVVDWLCEKELFKSAIDTLTDIIQDSLEVSDNVVAAIGCTGGHHRSVAIVEMLDKVFDETAEVFSQHRELHFGW